MSDLEITIRTLADLAGAQATAAALQKDIDKAKELGARSSEIAGMEKELAKVNEAIAKYNEGMADGAEHQKMFGDKTHEVHAGLHALGELIPGVGQLARGLFTPGTLGIAAAGLALGYLSKVFGEIEERMKALADEAAKPLGDMLKAQGEAADEAANGFVAFALALENSAAGEDKLTKAMAGRLKVFKAQIDALKELAAAEEAAALAKVKAAEEAAQAAAGNDAAEKKRIAEEARKKEEDIRRATKAKDQAFDAMAAQKEIDEKKARLAAAQKNYPGEVDAAAAAMATANGPEARIKDLPERITNQEEAIKKANEEIAKKDEAYSDASAQASTSFGQEKGGPVQETIAAAKAALEEAINKRDALKAGLESDRKHLAALKVKKQQADAAAELLKKKAEADKKIIDDYPDDISQAEKILKIQQDAHRDAAAIEAGKSPPATSKAAGGRAADKGTVDPMFVELQRLAAELAYETQRKVTGHNDAGPIVAILTHILALQKSSAHKDAGQDKQLADLARKFEELKGWQGTVVNP